MSELVKSVTDETYDQEVVKSSLPVLIDFWAPWCGPCMALMPAIEALAPLYADQLKVVKVNADENPGLVEKFGVRGIPQLFYVNNGDSVTPVKERTRTRLAMELEELLG